MGKCQKRHVLYRRDTQKTFQKTVPERNSPKDGPSGPDFASLVGGQKEGQRITWSLKECSAGAVVACGAVVSWRWRCCFLPLACLPGMMPFRDFRLQEV
jgi:hypothetical protein